MLPFFDSPEAGLTIFEGESGVPFSIARVFTITTRTQTTRGDHAHRACSQMLVCLAGRCDVTVDDGQTRVVETLETPNEGLLVPPGHWLKLAFGTEPSAMAVFCDRIYEPDDYIHDYAEFLEFRQ